MVELFVNFRRSRPALFGNDKPWGLGCLVGLLVQAGISQSAVGQCLEAVGVAASFNITQTWASPSVISVGRYTLLTEADRARYDDVGYHFAAYARWQASNSRFFVQPELGYTSSRGNSYFIAYYVGTPGPLGPDVVPFSHALHRWELAALAGLHTGRRTYLLAGPVLVVNRREALVAVDPASPSSAVSNSLVQSVEPVQLLGQVGVGFLAGRFDFNLRYEQSLTPYSRRFVFENNFYGYRQQVRQGLFTAGFLLYKNKQQLPEEFSR